MDDPECSNWQTYGTSVCNMISILSVHSLTAIRLVWNLTCGFAQNESQLLAFRFLAGLGGSAPLAVCKPSQVGLYPITE